MRMIAMNKQTPQPILAQPLQPGLFKICPQCRKWFALKLVAAKPDPDFLALREYHCKYCGGETLFAARLPAGVD